MAIPQKEPAMTCPGCRGRMSPEDREPILCSDGLVDVTYFCEWCGTEAKRAISVGWVEPPGRPSSRYISETHRPRRIGAIR
jgi:hypothetical protein